ncbi:MAG: hypothetical protein JWN76_2995 [Chitinophagaceae bacterium]|nr:hypothetical protein [Chitinophagaceae bacterium]
MRKFAVLLLIGFQATLLSAQDFSNKGKDFWITYPAHIDGTTSVLGVYITSNVNATGTITVNSQVISFSVTANSITEKFIGSSSAADASNSYVYLSQLEENKAGAAIHVVSDNPVVVYAHIIHSARSGATLVLPSTVWGREYIVPSYSSTQTGTGQGYGTLTIVAADSNTAVQITPTAKSANGSHLAGSIYTITLAKPGDVYQVQFQQGADISGTYVQSVSTGTGCKKIAVFSSTTWSSFGCASANSGDNLYQQLFPTGAWGKGFLTAPFKTRTSYITRVFIKTPGTVVTKLENGVTTTLSPLINNSFYEFTTGNPTYIEGTAPISVVQYSTTQTCQSGATISDPEMVVINPIEQTINNITVFSAYQGWINAKFPGQSNITNCYLNIIIKSNAASTFKINGAAPSGTFTAIPGTVYSYLQEDVTTLSKTNPVQTLKADSNFIAIAYGFGNVESYGYNAGTNVVDLSQGLLLQNPYTITTSQTTCRGTSTVMAVKFAYQPTSITWDFGNNPDISPNGIAGPFDNPKPDSSFIDNSSGKTIYVYKLPSNYTFNANGSYNFIITSNNPTSDGCSGIQQQTYTVNVVDPVIAKFQFTNSGCLSDSLRFIDSSNGNGRAITQWLWDFKDNTTSNLQNPAKKYSTPGSYNVALRVINDLGCYADTTATVAISDNPVVSFSSSLPACVNSTINFTDHSTIASGTIVSWKWDYANGSIDSLGNNSIRSQVYTASGTYPVKLTLQTNTGCVATDSVSVKINDNPLVKFVLPEVCLADAFALFTDSSTIADHTESQFKYLWNFGDQNSSAANNISTVQNPQHKYTQSAHYNVSLRITSGAGCVDSLTQAFTVNGAIPKADFLFVNTGKICSNKDVVIKDTSTVDFGSITKVEIIWDNASNPSIIQKDDNPAPGKTYAHAYPSFNTPSPKTYQVLFRSYSGGSCVSQITKSVTIYSTPLLSFSTIPGICNEAQPYLIAQAHETANNPGNFIYSGNGISAAGMFNPVQSGAGVWPIKYTYTTNDGCLDSISKNITVWPSPTAKFGVSSPVCEKNTLNFYDSSVANYSNIISWNWNFNDGTTAIKNAPASFNKTYAAAGNYQVSLQVKTDSGCTNTIINSIVVHPLPAVDFSMPAGVCLPDGKAQFNDLSSIADHTENSFSYLWSFGDVNDVTASTQKNPVHTYTTTGSKIIWLHVTSKDGCVDSLTKTFDKIFPQPQSDFTTLPTEVCLGQPILFTDKSDGITSPVTQWQWQMGNGTKFASQNVNYIFSQTGTFQVQLQITNQQGCIGTIAKQTVIIHPYPTVNAGPDLKILEGGSDTLMAVASGNQLVYKWTPASGLSNDAILQPIVKPMADQVYTITVTGEGNCSVTDDVAIVVLKMPVPPNAFSPNGDGINDTWIIKYLDTYPGCTVDIFDRYGQIIFHSTGYSLPWDGSSHGKLLPIGTYYYIIDPKNGRNAFTGYVIILK